MSHEATVTTGPEAFGRSAPLYAWYAALVIAVAVGLYGRPLIAIGVLGVATAAAFSRWLTSWRTVLTGIVLSVMLLPANLYKLPASLPVDVEVYRLLVFVLFLMWLVALLTDPSVSPRRSFLDVPFLVVVVAVILSFATNLRDFEPSLEFTESAKGLLYVLTFMVLFWCVVSIVRDNRLSIQLVHTIVYVAAVLAVLGVFERLTGYNIFRHLHEFVPILEPATPDMGFTVMRGGLRVSGSTAHPIAFGTMLALVLPFPVELLLESRGRWERAKWGVLSVLIMVGMLLTVSRTAFLGLMVTLVALAVSRPKQRLVLALCAVVTGLAIHLFFPGVIGRFVDNLTPSNVVSRELSTRASRLADYPFIVEEFSKKPLVGRGVGTFTHDRFFFVDNQYLKYLVELGLFGMSAMLVLFIAAAVALTRRGGRIGGPAGALVSAAGISAWVYALVNATFDAQGFPQVPYTFYMLLGLGVATALNSAQEQSAPGLPDGTSAAADPT